MGNQMFDQYTYLHVATGIMAYFWGISLIMWIVLHTLFEWIENTDIGIYAINHYMIFWPGGKPYADSKLNSVGDTIGALLGWLSAYGLDKYGEYRGWYVAHL